LIIIKQGNEMDVEGADLSAPFSMGAIMGFGNKSAI